MKSNSLTFILCLLAGTFSIISCNKEDQPEIDQQLIEDFIAEHNLDADSTSSGLYYVIDVPGSADHPTLSDEVTVSYVGFLLNGDIFDSAPNITFPLNQVIAGWQEGIPLFGRGGKGLLIIPSRLAYGEQARVGIPANSVLAFEINLIDF
ncbi:MAG: FKBP-type peptidyl-prolyl cis-trans isomerase [Saprospiraceae bacterium]|nr:FKBP-type peptidyl-prolyl cis-trans isomerase [Candidatus Opimibacter iunctus]